jgi:hypothetical protein
MGHFALQLLIRGGFCPKGYFCWHLTVIISFCAKNHRKLSRDENGWERSVKYLYRFYFHI